MVSWSVVKFYSWSKKSYCFQKIVFFKIIDCNSLCSFTGLHEGRPSYRRSLQPSLKRTFSIWKHEISSLFLFFGVIPALLDPDHHNTALYWVQYYVVSPINSLANSTVLADLTHRPTCAGGVWPWERALERTACFCSAGPTPTSPQVICNYYRRCSRSVTF